MVDANIGARVGELPDCFMSINSMDNAVSDDVQHLDVAILENQLHWCEQIFRCAVWNEMIKLRKPGRTSQLFQVCLSNLNYNRDFS
jgi:hypothetical protein